MCVSKYNAYIALSLIVYRTLAYRTSCIVYRTSCIVHHSLSYIVYRTSKIRPRSMVSTTKLSTTFIVIFHFGTFHSCTLPLPLRPPAIPCTLCLLCVFCLPPRLGLRLNVHTGGGACSAPFRPFPTPHPFFPIRDPTTKLANLRGYQAYELKVLAGPAPPRPHAPLAVHALG